MRALLVLFALVVAAAAAGPTPATLAQRFPLTDSSVEFVNPCTGNLTTVTLSNHVWWFTRTCLGQPS